MTEHGPTLVDQAFQRLRHDVLTGSFEAGMKLKVDELLTRTYPFAEINDAYAALERGEVARSVVTFP